jgi:type IV pilus biogenesis protein CpaD/CtpE
MAMGPNSVVVVRSEYRIATRNCPNYNPASTWNPNESVMPGFGCADAYNLGQMLARPRDAAVGRSAGPADATVNAEAVQRYREGRVRSISGGSTTAAGGGATTGGGGGATTGAN